MEFTIENTIDNARAIEQEFLNKVNNVTYEDKGILFSEMLFLYSAFTGTTPLQILESGRARAQSTLVLSLCFPDTQIVSIERYRDSEDAEIADRRLRNQSNTALLFGDSINVLPHLVLPGDIVLIDGPKRFRAVRLALNMLATGKPAAVFVHDCYRGLPERDYLETRVPGAFFSDHPRFVENFSKLDEPCWGATEKRDVPGWRPYSYNGITQQSYGPTLACIPRLPGISYSMLTRKLGLYELITRLGGKGE